MVTAVFIYSSILLGYSFSVALADGPQLGLGSATAAALPFLTFALLALIAAVFVGRAVTRRASLAMTTAARGSLWVHGLF